MYQKTNAVSEIKRVGKDNFWAKAEVSAAAVRGGTDRRPPGRYSSQLVKPKSQGVMAYSVPSLTKSRAGVEAKGAAAHG